MRSRKGLLKLLKEKGMDKGMDNVLVIGGGTIPDKDAQELKALGVAEIFRPGTTSDTIVNFIRKNVRKQFTAPPSKKN